MRATPFSVQELSATKAASARAPLHPLLLASIASAGIVAVAGLAYLYRPQPQMSVGGPKPAVAALVAPVTPAAPAAPVATKAPSVAVVPAAAVSKANSDPPTVQAQQGALAAKPMDDAASLAAARAAAERQLAALLAARTATPDPTLSQATAAQQPATAAEITASPAPTATATADASTIVLSTADLQRLSDKAAEAIRTGDIASARLVLERAEQGGDITAIYALAQTFDPRVLQSLHVQGLKGDAAKARQLYQQALDAGVTDAKDKLSGL